MTSPIQDRELLPCPFCASTNVHTIIDRGTPTHTYTYVACYDCTTRGPTFSEPQDPDATRTVAAWNRRPPVVAEPTFVETLASRKTFTPRCTVCGNKHEPHCERCLCSGRVDGCATPPSTSTPDTTPRHIDVEGGYNTCAKCGGLTACWCHMPKHPADTSIEERAERAARKWLEPEGAEGGDDSFVMALAEVIASELNSTQIPESHSTAHTNRAKQNP